MKNVTIDPKTPYVSVFLKIDQRSEPIKVTALLDSGCEKTIMHTRIFERLRNTGKIELTPLNEVAVSSCTGDKSIPAGVANVIMMFEGDFSRRVARRRWPENAVAVRSMCRLLAILRHSRDGPLPTRPEFVAEGGKTE